MVRALRTQYEGASYHLICRGNERKNIFRDEQDRKEFLALLRSSLKAYNIILYCYVLMDNHFHLLLETPLGNLSEFMRQFNIIYTSYFNRRYQRTGHLYQGRHKSVLVDKDSYLIILSRYIHLNPIRTKRTEKRTLNEKRSYLRNYRWSSLAGYINKERELLFIDYRAILEPYGGENDRGRKGYWKAICGDIEEGIEIKESIAGGGILGREEFIEWIKDNFLGKVKKRELPAANRT